jgi:hypothetical protein
MRWCVIYYKPEMHAHYSCIPRVKKGAAEEEEAVLKWGPRPAGPHPAWGVHQAAALLMTHTSYPSRSGSRLIFGVGGRPLGFGDKEMQGLLLSPSERFHCKPSPRTVPSEVSVNRLESAGAFRWHLLAAHAHPPS